MTSTPEPFAVDLSNDGIFLWYQKPGKKWDFLGSVPLNAGNLRQQLEQLKSIADKVEAPSLDAIVRIPTDEVQTLSIAHQMDTDTSWDSKILSALEVASGEPIDTLAFDIEGNNDTSDINIAWTSNATLRQANIFVHLIGFTPTYFTTDIDSTKFPRNPKFKYSTDLPLSENKSDLQKSSQSNTLSFRTVRETDTPLAPGVQTAKYKKGDFGFTWYIALFLLLAIIFIGIYFWPSFTKVGNMMQNNEKKQLNSATLDHHDMIHFVKSKTIL